jgi:hypothetical protein
LGKGDWARRENRFEDHAILPSMRGTRAWIESHQTVTIIVGVVLFVSVVVAVMSKSAPSAASDTEPASQAGVAASSTTISAAEAENQFKDLMDTGEKAGLVSSYAFSETERIIYVTPVWGAMTVAFKKDFLAKVAMLQEAISGRHFFEVRDDHSNVKVGEVTAFSGSLEVYK